MVELLRKSFFALVACQLRLTLFLHDNLSLRIGSFFFRFFSVMSLDMFSEESLAKLILGYG